LMHGIHSHGIALHHGCAHCYQAAPVASTSTSRVLETD